MNWSPRSTNAICAPMRPRSSSSKKRPYHASASSMSPTSSATWLMPTRRATCWNRRSRWNSCASRGVVGDVEGRPRGERELALRAQRGDATAYEDLVRPHQEIAFRVAYVITRNAQDAEDATQDALVKAWRAVGRFRADEPLRPWLLRIVANEARNRRRSAGRRERLALRAAESSGEAAPSPEDTTLAREQRAELLRALDELPDA